MKHVSTESDSFRRATRSITEINYGTDGDTNRAAFDDVHGNV